MLFSDEDTGDGWRGTGEGRGPAQRERERVTVKGTQKERKEEG